LTSIGQEEREKHLLDFHLTYAQAHKPPAKKKTSIKQKANSGAESIVIKNKRGCIKKFNAEVNKLQGVWHPFFNLIFNFLLVELAYFKMSAFFFSNFFT